MHSVGFSEYRESQQFAQQLLWLLASYENRCMESRTPTRPCSYLRGAMTPPTGSFFTFDWFATHMFAGCRPIAWDGENAWTYWCSWPLLLAEMCWWIGLLFCGDPPKRRSEGTLLTVLYEGWTGEGKSPVARGPRIIGVCHKNSGVCRSQDLVELSIYQSKTLEGGFTHKTYFVWVKIGHTTKQGAPFVHGAGVGACSCTRRCRGSRDQLSNRGLE
jgi:hypothetical protein